MCQNLPIEVKIDQFIGQNYCYWSLAGVYDAVEHGRWCPNERFSSENVICCRCQALKSQPEERSEVEDSVPFWDQFYNSFDGAEEGWSSRWPRTIKKLWTELNFRIMKNLYIYLYIYICVYNSGGWWWWTPHSRF